MSNPSSLVGRIIDGRYRLEACVGNGSQGDTYRARHVEHQRVVAFKLLHERVNGADGRRRSFEAEIAALSGLGHPSIATLVDYGVHEGQPWLAVQWLEGETLEARLQRTALPLTAALAIVRQVLAALASAHALKLVHRNLKPSNVFLERSPTQGRERVKLLDFTPLLRPVAAGTDAPYAPPELLRGEALDSRSDVFAVGATLIAMLSAAPEAEPGLEASDKPVSVPARGRALPGVDATLLTWIRRATSPHKPLRFADGADALRELIDLLPRDLLSPPARVESANRTAPLAAGRPSVPARPSAGPSRPGKKPSARAARVEANDAPVQTTLALDDAADAGAGVAAPRRRTASTAGFLRAGSQADGDAARPSLAAQADAADNAPDVRRSRTASVAGFIRSESVAEGAESDRSSQAASTAGFIRAGSLSDGEG
ncbi:MAG TPA: serine/threonine-protein kinase, partial [Polyangiales bacterium]|nr:serine/threonine-protein kinase [Polyangiales bacterium]